MKHQKAQSIDIDALGSTIRLSILGDEPEWLSERLVQTWSGGTKKSGLPDATLTVGTDLSRSRKYDVFGVNYVALAARLSSKVTLCGIELARGKHLMLHAAGVALPDGRVVAFVAPSGGGKTTLAASLGKRFGYVSDETIMIDRDLRVYPYRKPLSVIEDPEEKWAKTQISPDELGLRPLPRHPLRLAAIVLFERDEEHRGRPEVGSLALPDAIKDISGQISYFSEIRSSVCMLADITEKTGGIRTLRYAEAEGVADVFDELLAASHHDTEWHDVSGEIVAGALDGELLRREHVVAVETAGSVITMSDKTLRVLSGLAPVIWREIAMGADVEQLEEALIQEFGIPDGVVTREVTLQAVETLRAAGLIRRHGEELTEFEPSS